MGSEVEQGGGCAMRRSAWHCEAQAGRCEAKRRQRTAKPSRAKALSGAGQQGRDVRRGAARGQGKAKHCAAKAKRRAAVRSKGNAMLGAAEARAMRIRARQCGAERGQSDAKRRGAAAERRRNGERRRRWRT